MANLYGLNIQSLPFSQYCSSGFNKNSFVLFFNFHIKLLYPMRDKFLLEEPGKVSHSPKLPGSHRASCAIKIRGEAVIY